MNKKEKIIQFLKEKPGYLKKSSVEVGKRLIDCSYTLIEEVQKELRKGIRITNRDKIVLTAKELLSLNKKPLILQYDPKDVAFKPVSRKLLLDIEVSPNLVYSWRVGNKINLSIENIVKERAIICISYKWLGENKTYTIAWNKGDDKELLTKFAKIMNTADEVITHNGDSFDIKWIRGRCIFHNIPLNEKFNSIDTLKLAKRQFNFNSNKLTYISKFLGLGEKIGTEYSLWKRVLNNEVKALNEMIVYCEQDINLLEQVYNKLEKYSPMKKYKYIKR